MDSSFLTWVNVGLAIYSGFLFLKLVIQFGLPNHPARFTAYLVSLCVAVFFILKAVTGLGLLAPGLYLKWSLFPMVAGSVGVLFQAITSVGQFTRIQQRIFSRLPLFTSLICFGLFPTRDTVFFTVAIVAGCTYLAMFKDKARYQKRAFFKMAIALLIFSAFRLLNLYWAFIVGELFLFLAVFYFFVFEQAIGVSALVEDKQTQLPGDAP